MNGSIWMRLRSSPPPRCSRFSTWWPPELGAEANAAYEDLVQLNLELFSFEPFASRIWELRHTVTSDDAWYVAVTEALKLPLATLDERLARTKGPTCDFLTPGG